MKKLLKLGILCSMSGFSLSGYAASMDSNGDSKIVVSTKDAGTILMGDGFTFTATVAAGDLSQQGLVITVDHGETVTTTPAGCALAGVGSTCSYTVTTPWNNNEPNNFTAPYQIKLSAGSAVFNTNAISYVYTAPAVYLPATGAPPSEAIKTGIPYPSPRFTGGSGADAGCLTDNLTGLTWAKNSDITAGKGATWDAAQQLAQNYSTTCSANSKAPWRQPTVNELRSLVNDSDKTSPAAYLAAQGFAGGSGSVQEGSYWSSNLTALVDFYAWDLNMANGMIEADDIDGSQFFVWPVRGGQ